jgi:hypothetical protein
MNLRHVCRHFSRLPLLALVLVGCAVNRPDTSASLHEMPASQSAPDPAASGIDLVRVDPGASLRIVDLSFDVFRADLPVTAGRASRKIWNHVDELRSDAAVVARLARNGFRVGAAPRGSWPAIQAVLESTDARTYRNMLAPPRGAPLLVTMGPVTDRESIFTYNAEHRLTGRTFVAGEKVIAIDYAFQPQFGGFTELQVGFEVQHDKGVMTWTRDGGVIRQVPDIERHVFSDLTTQLTLERGECLVIGPSETAANEYLIGGRYLSIEHDGRPHESMLFITPTPYQTKAAAGGRP